MRVTGTGSEIGTLNENPLHAALKEWYARPGDRFEVPVAGYVIDIVRNDLLIEVQTGGFSPLKTKLNKLSETRPVRLVYPVAQEKWILRLNDYGGRLGRRRSPKHGAVEDVFAEMVRIPSLLARSNFSLEVLLIHEEEVRRLEPGRAWRRKGWVVCERRLIDVVKSHLMASPADAAGLLPADLPDPFTTADIAEGLDRPRWLAQKMAYCLRAMGVIELVGKDGNAVLYTSAA
jgi:hypothetical protein